MAFHAKGVSWARRVSLTSRWLTTLVWPRRHQRRERVSFRVRFGAFERLKSTVGLDFSSTYCLQQTTSTSTSLSLSLHSMPVQTWTDTDAEADTASRAIIGKNFDDVFFWPTLSFSLRAILTARRLVEGSDRFVCPRVFLLSHILSFFSNACFFVK